MRITYRTLAALVALMDEDQKDSDVTVEIPYGEDGSSECFSGELRIAGEDHDGGLDLDHPVIFVHQDEGEHVRRNDAAGIAIDIGLGQKHND